MGEITAITLMGTDVERIVNGMQFFHEVWGSLLDVAIASWLLSRQLFLACLVPIILVVGKLTKYLPLWRHVPTILLQFSLHRCYL